MSGTNNLNIPQMDDTTAGKAAFLNDMFAVVDQSITATLSVDCTNNASETSTAISNYARILAMNVPSDGTTLTLGPVIRMLMLGNDAASVGNVTFACGTSTIVVAPKKIVIAYMDGTPNGLLAVVSPTSLASLADVNVNDGNAEDGMVLTFNAATNKWIAAAPSGSGGGSSGPVTSRYWRMSSMTSTQNAASIAEIAWQDASGAKITQTALGGTFGEDLPASNLVDGNVSTFSSCNVGGYVSFDFGTAVTPAALVVTNRNDGYPQFNYTSFDLQYSLDGTVWRELAQIVSPSTAGGAVATYNIPSR